MSEQSFTGKKGNTIFSVLGWTFGVLFLLMLLISLLTPATPPATKLYSVILGLGFGVAGLLVLPPSLKVARSKLSLLEKSFAPPLLAFGAIFVFSAIGQIVDPQPASPIKATEIKPSRADSQLEPAAIASAETSSKKSPDTTAKASAKRAPQSPASSEPSTNKSEEAAVPVLTNQQRNAVRAATNYVNMSGFSKKGLIDQLSSSFGDDFDVADATAAVNSMTIDWNENAARSAKNYLDMSGFSCQGLIEQLSSSAGDKYTKSQATYGARQAGAC
jgi:hypothetical protein